MEIITDLLGVFVFFGIIYSCYRPLEIFDMVQDEMAIGGAILAGGLMFLHGWLFLSLFDGVLEPLSIHTISVIGSIVMCVMLCVAIFDAMINRWWRVLTTSIPLAIFIVFFVLRLMAAM